MSFKCAVTEKIVENQKQVLVPSLKRKVEYQKIVNRKDKKGQSFNILVGEPTTGWEVVSEVSTTPDMEADLIAKYKDNFEPGIKKVLVRVPNSVLIKYNEKKAEVENPFEVYIDL